MESAEISNAQLTQSFNSCQVEGSTSGINKCRANIRESTGTCVLYDQVSSPTTTTAPPVVPAILLIARLSEATCIPTLFINAIARILAICDPFKRATLNASLFPIWATIPLEFSRSAFRSNTSKTSASGEPG